MNEVYPGESRYILDAFHIYQGRRKSLFAPLSATFLNKERSKKSLIGRRGAGGKRPGLPRGPGVGGGARHGEALPAHRGRGLPAGGGGDGAVRPRQLQLVPYVQEGGGLVQHQHLRLLVQRPGQQHPLSGSSPSPGGRCTWRGRTWPPSVSGTRPGGYGHIPGGEGGAGDKVAEQAEGRAPQEAARYDRGRTWPPSVSGTRPGGSASS